MNSVPLWDLVGLFACLMIVGLLITLPLFHWQLRRLVSHKLFTKIVWWIPIFAVFVAYLYLPLGGRVVISILLIWRMMHELLRQRQQRSFRLAILYATLVSALLLHGLLYGHFQVQPVRDLIAVCIGSAVSDVVAFFMGSYVGRHKLPAQFNSTKSWEGVIGQFLGALLGVWLVRLWIDPSVLVLLGISVGVGSAAGDLFNSFTKRRLSIKDWGESIPGHGGYLDRLSSMSAAIALSWYFLLIAK